MVESANKNVSLASSVEEDAAYSTETAPISMKRLWGTYCVLTLAVFVVTRLRDLPFGNDLVPLSVAGLFLVLAITRVGYRLDALEAHGMALGGLLAPAPPSNVPVVFDLWRLLRENAGSIARESTIAVGLAILVFPPFILAFGWWNHLSGWPAPRLPEDFALFSLAQIIVVAIPEEAFFRGYFQTRLGRRFNLLPTLVLQAAAFALIHLVVDYDQPTRLAVFLPGLLFGLIRHWRGGIGAAVLFHALCNMLGEFLYRSWVLVY